jgi:hypothetical protein
MLSDMWCGDGDVSVTWKPETGVGGSAGADADGISEKGTESNRDPVWRDSFGVRFETRIEARNASAESDGNAGGQKSERRLESIEVLSTSQPRREAPLGSSPSM